MQDRFNDIIFGANYVGFRCFFVFRCFGDVILKHFVPPGASPGATHGATHGASPGASPGATPRATHGATHGASPGATPRATHGATHGSFSSNLRKLKQTRKKRCCQIFLWVVLIF